MPLLKSYAANKYDARYQAAHLEIRRRICPDRDSPFAFFTVRAVLIIFLFASSLPSCKDGVHEKTLEDFAGRTDAPCGCIF